MYEFSTKCKCGKRGVTYNGQGEIVCYDCSSDSHKKIIMKMEKKMIESIDREGSK